MVHVAIRPSSSRRDVRRVSDPVVDRRSRWDPAESFVFALGFLLLASASIAVLALIPRPRSAVDPAIGSDRIPQERSSLVPYTNVTGGYAFTYPSSWDIVEAGPSSQLRSPSGDIGLSFGFGAPGSLETASERLLESMPGLGTSRRSVGAHPGLIDGSRSLLSSGTAYDHAGRPVRFLAIAVRGEVRNYAIGIVVPAGSDPNRVLPLVERIVASFEILWDGDVIIPS
jgi:hypothetical protein